MAATERRLVRPVFLMNITVRKATEADIPQLVGLMAEFYAAAGFSLAAIWANRSFSALLADQSRGAAWIVAEDAAPVGYVILTVRFSMEHGGLDGFIDDLFVRPLYRRRGFGRLALQALFDECRRRGVLAVSVEAGPDNAGAQALYASHGLALRRDRRELLTVSLHYDTVGT